MMLSSSLLPSWMVLLLVCTGYESAFGFSARPSPSRHAQTTLTTTSALQAAKKDYSDGEVGDGPNWIEKSFPVGTTDKIDAKKVEDYNLGIAGEAFQTGPLSKRMFDAIASRSSMDMSEEIRDAFMLCAMDFTAKEATRAALSQNGLEMVLQEEEEDQGMWGDVDTIRLYDEDSGVAFSTTYDSLEDAVEEWEPGQTFDFVARQVPAKIRELSIEELVDALDPDGALREEAKATKGDGGDDDGDGGDIQPSEEALAAIFDDDEIASLSDLASENSQRVQATPQEATPDDEAFDGLDAKGYNVISRSDLLPSSRNEDGTENQQTLMHVMNALVSHGVLIVDVADGDKAESNEAAGVLTKMWDATAKFFEDVDGDSPTPLAGLTTATEAGSDHAKVGFVSYNNDSMAFLETRRHRETQRLHPEDAHAVLGEDAMNDLGDAFDVVAEIGKDVIRIVTAASSVEYGAFAEGMMTDEQEQSKRASSAAILLADELIDDGKPLKSTADIDSNESAISMSPHRLCRYSDKQEPEDEAAAANGREVFGAHTDASFVTAVPVAAVNGLEVFDEEADKWYRPELRARAHWIKQHGSEIGEGAESTVPWHARYVAIMAGEHMQLCTRNEVPATVHRVVSAKNKPSRLSSPILLRGRPGVKFDADRYLGGTLGNPILDQCDNKTMEAIYTETQPKASQ